MTRWSQTALDGLKEFSNRMVRRTENVVRTTRPHGGPFLPEEMSLVPESRFLVLLDEELGNGQFTGGTILERSGNTIVATNNRLEEIWNFTGEPIPVRCEVMVELIPGIGYCAEHYETVLGEAVTGLIYDPQNNRFQIDTEYIMAHCGGGGGTGGPYYIPTVDAQVVNQVRYDQCNLYYDLLNVKVMGSEVGGTVNWQTLTSVQVVGSVFEQLNEQTQQPENLATSSFKGLGVFDCGIDTETDNVQNYTECEDQKGYQPVEPDPGGQTFATYDAQPWERVNYDPADTSTINAPDTNITAPDPPVVGDQFAVGNRTKSRAPVLINGNGSQIQDPMTGEFEDSISVNLPYVSLEWILTVDGWAIK